MKGTMMTISPTGSIHTTHLDAEPELQQLREGVGGDIELVPMFDNIERDGEVHECIAYCNEMGKLDGLPFNMYATALWDRALMRRHPAAADKRRRGADYLVGSIVVLYGDKAFMEAQ
jgi:hypothetical protein